MITTSDARCLSGSLFPNPASKHLQSASLPEDLPSGARKSLAQRWSKAQRNFPESIRRSVPRATTGMRNEEFRLPRRMIPRRPIQMLAAGVPRGCLPSSFRRRRATFPYLRFLQPESPYFPGADDPSADKDLGSQQFSNMESRCRIREAGEAMVCSLGEFFRYRRVQAARVPALSKVELPEAWTLCGLFLLAARRKTRRARRPS